MITPQITIAREATLTGFGLHSGRAASVRFLPAPINSGARFVRTDLPGRPEIPVSTRSARSERSEARRTVLAQGEAEVQTVEHVLATVAGLGIDNIIIEVDGPEPPEPSDGSAQPFVELLTGAGLERQSAPKRFLKVTRPVSLVEDGVEMLAVPYDGLRISFTIKYENRIIGTQHACFDLTADGAFAREIAPARTFALEKDLEMLRGRGLIKGGTLDNAVVVQEDGILNREPLRFPDEFVRHKILDLLGDLFVLGLPLRAHIVSICSGHATNVRFAKKLEEQLSDPTPRGVSVDTRTGSVVWDINAIQAIMPHRYPFLLVDRILELKERERVVGIKNVTINEPFFAGHFPGHPIMPAVLIIEAMAQVGGVLLLNTVDDPERKLVYFMGIDNAKFRKPVLPGDQIRFELELVKLKSRICKMHGTATVDGQAVAEADLSSTIVDR
jgi:UDP-3-O-[3-hydroxymyristoyl] N-acetylglucosamine deacetylase/3-hydroxyacyl-[acyl-carrier-protein] dehydratase